MAHEPIDHSAVLEFTTYSTALRSRMRGSIHFVSSSVRPPVAGMDSLFNLSSTGLGHHDTRYFLLIEVTVLNDALRDSKQVLEVSERAKMKPTTI